MDDIDRLIENSMNGDKRSTARLISLVERGDASTPYILEKIYPHAGAAFYIAHAARAIKNENVVLGERVLGQPLGLLFIGDKWPGFV